MFMLMVNVYDSDESDGYDSDELDEIVIADRDHYKNRCVKDTCEYCKE